MTKAELTKAIAQRSALSAPDARATIDALLGAVCAELRQGGRVEIRGFGAFATRLRPARTSRNPATGEAVHVPEKRVPVFRASKSLSVEIAPPPRYKLAALLAKCDASAPPPADIELLTDAPIGRELL